MRLLVAVKRVIDPYVKIRVKSDQTGVATENTKMSINPFDEIAVEEALRLRDSGKASRVICVSIGSQASQETLRHTLAMGADEAILIQTSENHCSFNIASVLKCLALEKEIDLVLMGKQSIDSDNNQTAQMLAALLDWPQATCASKIMMDDKEVVVVREIDSGQETLKLQLPSVISVDLRLNQPRYVMITNIMKSKSKNITVRELETLDLKLRHHINVIKTTAPEPKQAGILLQSIDELLAKIKEINEYASNRRTL